MSNLTELATTLSRKMGTTGPEAHWQASMKKRNLLRKNRQKLRSLVLQKVATKVESMTSTDIPVLIPGKMKFRKSKKDKVTKTGFRITTA